MARYDEARQREIAEAKEREANVERAKAVAAAEQEKQAKEDADQQRIAAEESARIAKSREKITVDTLRQVTFSLYRELRDRPGMQEIRKKFIDTVTRGLDQIQKAGFDPQAQDMVAAGNYSNLGGLNLELGRADAALMDYKRCLAIFEKLEKDGLLNNAFYNKSQIRMYMAAAETSAGNFDDAIKDLQIALEVRQAWLASLTSDATKIYVEQLVAIVYSQLGSANLSAGRVDEAKKWIESLLTIAEKRVRTDPNDVTALNELAIARWQMARIEFQSGDYENAMAHQQEVIESLQRIENPKTDSLNFVWNMVNATSELAKMQVYLDLLPAAKVNYTKAIESLRALCKDNPENYKLKQDLSGALYGLATVELQMKNDELSSTLYSESLALSQVIAEMDPENLPRKIGLALRLARVAKVDEALKLAEQLLARVEKDANSQFNLACVYAQIGQSLKEKENADKNSNNVEKMLNQARTLVESAKEGGYMRSADLERDPDLRPLRTTLPP